MDLYINVVKTKMSLYLCQRRIMPHSHQTYEQEEFCIFFVFTLLPFNLIKFAQLRKF